MSRAYRIRISETLERIVHVEDGVATTLELLPILPRERMQELLARELAAAGLTIEGGVARRSQSSEAGELTVEIELATGVVSVRVAKAKDLHLEHAGERVVDETSHARREALLREETRATLERDAAAATEATRREATAWLEGELRDVRVELDRVVHGVTAAALKERAGQLGEIEELTEDAEQGTLTIKVRL